MAMATDEHKGLANIIKSIHQNLRKESNILGIEHAWKNHCANENVLQTYSRAMVKLASYWDNNFSSNSNLKSRIEWVHAYSISYFFDGELERYRLKELKIASQMQLDACDCNFTNIDKILRLLDVGSCYNAFNKFSCFEVLPVDIAPAINEVYKCDFLNLEIDDNLFELSKNIVRLPQAHFDLVVFSLLLEYFPCPKQRMHCCLNAYKLLKFEGLLIIITPDSNHVGANAKIMKSWRYNLAQIGFSRIKYEKFSHIHCMAFRKSCHSQIAQRWSKLQNSDQFYNELVVPQDFLTYSCEDSKFNEFENDTDNLFILNELPQCFE